MGFIEMNHLTFPIIRSAFPFYFDISVDMVRALFAENGHANYVSSHDVRYKRETRAICLHRIGKRCLRPMYRNMCAYCSRDTFHR